LKKIKSFAVIAGALLRKKQNLCQPPKKEIELTRKNQRGNCTAPIVRSLTNSGAPAYNAGPLSGGKPLLRRRERLRSLEELNLKENFPRCLPLRNKRPRHLVENSSARLVKSSTNTELLVLNASHPWFLRIPLKRTVSLKYRVGPKLKKTVYKYERSRNNSYQR
jgi:hypothetical protein